MVPMTRAIFCAVFILLAACEKDATTEDENGILVTEEAQDPNEETNTPVAEGNANRDEAKALYETLYVASRTESGDVAWTGDEPACDPGSVPQATVDKIMNRLNYFRKAVGLHNTIALSAVKSEKAQRAALMMDANNALEHNPPESWKCYTADGNEAAGKSLLTTARNSESIDSYLRDAGSSNGPVGHRRWLLWPRLQEIGIGNTSGANAIWVIGNAGSAPVDAPEFISWPPSGYAPKQLIYPRWSFSLRNADFSGAQVSMQDSNGGNIALTVEDLAGGFGDATLVWVPEGINTSATDDVTYTVRISNVDVSGEIKSFEYETVLFDVSR